jgi:SAM-dependent methyltransferase
LSTERRLRFDKFTGYLRYPGKGARLLDVGCGNGIFLLQLRSLGWDVAGVEPDPKSAAAAAAAGLNVRVGVLEEQSLPDDHYDAITLSHVLEHLHQPRETLRFCRRILKPGGTLYVATPNFGAAGHRRFGSDWFPLDPPRHLVLFTPDSLKRLFKSTGFMPEPGVRLRLAAKEMFKRSTFLQNGLDPMGQKPGLPAMTRLKSRWLAWQADRATRRNPELAEELVLLAHRPGS